MRGGRGTLKLPFAARRAAGAGEGVERFSLSRKHGGVNRAAVHPATRGEGPPAHTNRRVRLRGARDLVPGALPAGR